jgi:hypothetical protein
VWMFLGSLALTYVLYKLDHVPWNTPPPPAP